MRRSIALAVALAFGAALAPSRPPLACADDEAWKARIERSLADVEKGVAELDGKTAAAGDLPARIAALHARLVPLEEAQGFEVGKISGKADLSSCTQDVGVLTTRWKAVVAVTSGVPKQPPPPPAEKPPAEPPAKPKSLVPDWPESLEFTIAAKIGWIETGEFRSVEVKEDVWENRFFADGFDATLSFNLIARGLVRDVKGVELLVAVRLAGPLATSQDSWRTYRLRWDGERGLGNESVRRFLNLDKFHLARPITVRTNRRKDGFVPEAHAHVVSATLKDGTVRAFTVPTYRTE